MTSRYLQVLFYADSVMNSTVNENFSLLNPVSLCHQVINENTLNRNTHKAYGKDPQLHFLNHLIHKENRPSYVRGKVVVILQFRLTVLSVRRFAQIKSSPTPAKEV